MNMQDQQIANTNHFAQNEYAMSPEGMNQQEIYMHSTNIQKLNDERLDAEADCKYITAENKLAEI